MDLPTHELVPDARLAMPMEALAETKPEPGRRDELTTQASADQGGGRAAIALEVRRLNPRATLPEYQTPGAAGMDLAACLAEGQTVRLAPGVIVLVPTGLAMAIPPGYEGQVRPRSGLATKFGVTVANAPGTIDSDYRGELRVALINLGKTEFVVEHGMRVAQLVIGPVVRANIIEVETLGKTQRGQGGFGSTGT